VKNLLSSLCALVCLTTAEAQVIPSARLYSTYTDNLFLSSSRRADWINLAFIDLDYSLNKDFGLYYSGSANYFADNGDLFNHLHQVGLSFARPFGTTGSFYAGSELGLRLDRSLYDYRDFTEMRAFASAKAYIGPDLLVRSSYSARRQSYLNAADYSFYEQNFNLRLTHFLPTRTTLQFGAELGWKTYARAAAEISFLDFAVPARFGQDRNLLQWVTRAKIAQSIGENIGLQIEWRRRTSLRGDSRYLGDLFYNPDDDLFDDRYSYSGQQLGSTLKYLAPLGLTLETSFKRQTRNYSSRPAYDVLGSYLGQSQQETRRTLRLGLEKSFFRERGWVREIGVDIEWLYRNIDSNDPFYDAEARAYTMGIQLGF